MKRQVAVTALLALMVFGAPVASGHTSRNTRCSFDVKGVHGKPKDGQTVNLLVRMKNTSGHTMRHPVMFLSIQSDPDSGEESVSLGHSTYRPGPLKPGEVSRDRYKIKADPGEVGHVWLRYCHRK